MGPVQTFYIISKEKEKRYFINLLIFYIHLNVDNIKNILYNTIEYIPIYLCRLEKNEWRISHSKVIFEDLSYLLNSYNYN